MQARTREKGAALILLLGIVATLAILSVTLVTVLANQQNATAQDRARKTGAYYTEAALDSAVRVAKGKAISTTSEWLTPAELATAFSGAGFPTGATISYRVYDNLTTVNYAIKWDQGSPASAITPDGMVWVEATVTYQGKTTRMRALVRQTTQSLVSSLPKAVLYSDTGIAAAGTSDVYALNPDGTPDTSGSPYPTSLMAGTNFTYNSNTDLAAPSTNVQSLAVRVNGNVTASGSTRTFNDVTARAGTVGLLSDYFDQGAQADLGDEAQLGAAHAAPPSAPSAPTALTSSGASVAPSKFSQANITTIPGVTYNATTKTYTFSQDILVSGDLELKSGTTTAAGVFPAGTTFAFRKLSIKGSNASSSDLILTGQVAVTATTFYSLGTLTINNTTTTTVTDSLGPLHVAGDVSISGRANVATTSSYVGGKLTIANGTTTTVADQLGTLYVVGALDVSGPVTLTTSSLYAGGAATIGNSTTTALLDELGTVYVVGALTATGSVAVHASTLYSGGTATITGPSSSTITDEFGLLYANAGLTLSGNVQARSTALVVGGNLAISGATSPIVDQFGPIWVGGSALWSGTVSVKTTDYTSPLAAPGTMWIGTIFAHTWPSTAGTWRYADVYGDTWISGNAGTGNVAINFTGPTTGTTACVVMCPLLATTEKTTTSGRVDFGTRTEPMTFYMMCDNDGLYSNTCEWGSSGTFYGLMVIMEAIIQITGGSGTQPSIEGAIFCGTPYVSGTTPSTNDISLSNGSSVAYNQSIIDKVANASITTTTTTTTVVPGSWQQLSATD